MRLTWRRRMTTAEPSGSDEAQAARITAEKLHAQAENQLQEFKRLAAASREQRRRNHFGEALARAMLRKETP